MTCRVHPLNSCEGYRFVVVYPRYRGRWLFTRHRLRDTWETAGGHIEPGEVPLMAAKRELWEETGAVEFDIAPVFDYWAGDDTGSAYGMVFMAEVHVLGEIPECEVSMAEVKLFDGLPEKLTYPGITPVLFAQLPLQKDCHPRP